MDSSSMSIVYNAASSASDPSGEWETTSPDVFSMGFSSMEGSGPLLWGSLRCCFLRWGSLQQSPFDGVVFFTGALFGEGLFGERWVGLAWLLSSLAVHYVTHLRGPNFTTFGGGCYWNKGCHYGLRNRNFNGRGLRRRNFIPGVLWSKNVIDGDQHVHFPIPCCNFWVKLVNCCWWNHNLRIRYSLNRCRNLIIVGHLSAMLARMAFVRPH